MFPYRSPLDLANVISPLTAYAIQPVCRESVARSTFYPHRRLGIKSEWEHAATVATTK